MLNVLSELIKAIENREAVALATVIDVQGASPAQVGFKLLVLHDSRCVGNMGGGELENRIREESQSALKEGRARTVHYSLKENGEDAIGTLYGGDFTVFIEPYVTRPILLIVGGGHIGRPLSEMARIAGYDVKIVDLVPERGDGLLLDPATITADTYVAIITEDHVADKHALHNALPTHAAYIGMIGSRQKIVTIMEHLCTDGFTDDQLARVRAPIGLDLGGGEPAQIALAIIAEIEMVRHGGSGRPRSEAMKTTLRRNTKGNENPV